MLDVIPKVRGKRGQPRQRPDLVLADHGYDHDKYRRLVRELRIRPLITRRGTEHGEHSRSLLADETTNVRSNVLVWHEAPPVG
ncbi:hypothetical protein ACWDOR_19200 [Streptosporangium canum]|uniref:hypothetical protein n=1 Tax=Streptosporangium canum TaxID=324952 RepID=UPI0036A3E3DF